MTSVNDWQNVAMMHLPEEYVAIRSLTSFRMVHKNMRTRYKQTPTIEALKMNCK